MKDGIGKKLRVIIPVALIAGITVAYIAKAPIGDLSAFGWGDFTILCPLGALEAMIATHTLIPAGILSLICFVLLVILVGKAFCAWACPVPIVKKLRGVFSSKKQGDEARALEAGDASASAQGSSAESGAKVIATVPLAKDEKASLRGACSSDAGCASCASKRGVGLDSRHLILGGALGTALIFGFPVFCLVCPIGLTFATVFLLVNLFAHGDVTWMVIVVPLILLAEVVFFRKWCHRICPIAALMSLTSKANRTLVPVIDNEKCLETAKGVACGRCGKACGEGIDLRHPELSVAAMNECTKCRVCADVCPSDAISFPIGPIEYKRMEKKREVSEIPASSRQHGDAK